jgi:hypothetical protein
MSEPVDFSPECTPEQAAFLMRHLSDDDRARMIAEAGEKVIDLCDSRRVPLPRSVFGKDDG